MIAENVASVRKRVCEAEERSGRDPNSIQLLAVSKGHGVDDIKIAIESGLDCFGENYLNELAEKAAVLPANWYYQGALQTRKIREIVKYSRNILSVSREKELIEIGRRTEEPVACHIEVNIAGEATKGGAEPEAIAGILAAANDLPNVAVIGLMCIPPFDPDPESSRPYFRRLRGLAEDHGLSGLSMGMTNDFEVAVEEGATMIRVGTGIFGER